MDIAAFVDGLHRAGTEQALVFGLEKAFFGPSRPANDTLAQAVKPYAGELFPVCTIHPRDEGAAVDEMERCASELGMVALKLHPWLQAFSVVEAGLIPIMRTAARLGWPVIFHDGTPPYSTPLQIAYLAEQVPEATIILGHAGLSDFPMEALAAGQRCPNIYLCPCGVPLNWMRAFVDKIGCERILYGSDYPFGGPASLHYYLAKIRALNLSPGDEEQVVSGNIRRIIPALCG
ncbi:MAG: amidohydrolase [Chloroflexi bacterium]|nr:MAG: amidohydrolase [Chloroflexota bacterium]